MTVRPERRRRWRAEDKYRIVQETLTPGAVVMAVARRHGISTGLLYTWRRQALARAMSGFLPVQVVADASASPLPDTATPPSPETSSSPARSVIEIVLSSGVSLRVDASVDEDALRRVLSALEGRRC